MNTNELTPFEMGIIMGLLMRHEDEFKDDHFYFNLRKKLSAASAKYYDTQINSE